MREGKGCCLNVELKCVEELRSMLVLVGWTCSLRGAVLPRAGFKMNLQVSDAI